MQKQHFGKVVVATVHTGHKSTAEQGWRQQAAQTARGPCSYLENQVQKSSGALRPENRRLLRAPLSSSSTNKKHALRLALSSVDCQLRTPWPEVNGGYEELVVWINSGEWTPIHIGSEERYGTNYDDTQYSVVHDTVASVRLDQSVIRSLLRSKSQDHPYYGRLQQQVLVIPTEE